jgi:Flp pilus assembly protein TadG
MKSIVGRFRNCVRRRDSARILDDESGASILIIAFSFLAIAGFVGLAVEVGYWYFERRAMQAATDSAALSGAYIMFKAQSLVAANDPDITAAAKNDAKRNGYDDADADVTVTVTHPYSGDLSRVEVTMTKTEAGNFSALFGNGGATISRRAVAKVDNTGNNGDFCMLGLAPNCSQTIKINGTNNANLAGCPIMSNSISQDSFFGSGSAHVTTPSVASAGQSSIGNNFNLTLPAGVSPISNAQPLPDPYSNIPEYPNPGGCQNIANVNCGGANAGNAGCSVGNRKVLTPGCYNNMNFQNNRFYKLSQGNFYTNGAFSVGPSSVVSDPAGTGVTIHLGPNGTADVQSTATLDLRANTAGTYAGILFFQSRSATLDNCTAYTNQFNGGSNQRLNGTLYFPRQGVSLNGNNTSSGTACLRIVSQYLRLNGTSNIDVSCTGISAGGGMGGGGTDYLPPTLVE